MTDLLDVTTSNGKYRIRQNEKGRVSVDRNGDPWRDNVFDSVTLQLAYELDAARKALDRADDLADTAEAMVDRRQGHSNLAGPLHDYRRAREEQ